MFRVGQKVKIINPWNRKNNGRICVIKNITVCRAMKDSCIKDGCPGLIDVGIDQDCFGYMDEPLGIKSMDKFDKHKDRLCLK